MGSKWQRFLNWLEPLLICLPGLEAVKNWQAPALSAKHSQKEVKDFLLSSLIFLFSTDSSAKEQAQKYLKRVQLRKDWQQAVNFIFSVQQEIQKEVEDYDCPIVPEVDPRQPFLPLWKVLFPEGFYVYQHQQQAEENLRQKRMVSVQRKNQEPISNPVEQILFTSNVLLGPPLGDGKKLAPEIKDFVQAHRGEAQKYWYDHPIPLDAPPENNEILYGLTGLDQALEFEKQRGTVVNGQKLTVVLSCSVTHPYLQQIARPYVKNLIAKHGGFKNLEVYLFTETDCQQMINQVLKPAAQTCLNVKEDFEVFGVNGEYGRHYTFLKAVAAFWRVFINAQIKATFKIDLDQVFPQENLVRELGKSAFELFCSPLWGAEGLDFKQNLVKLDLIAGALVNARDIEKSLFTPDVPYPGPPIQADEHIFFSQLPQALSTRVEMMTRYLRPPLNGQTTCLQRVHVTGGTNGILIEALFKYRPFTPSFFGRAEDQAFILSFFKEPKPLLRYFHQPGLIMRHDKQLFASESIKAAQPGKIIGDYVRMLYFSAYARFLTKDIRIVKEELDPFTGCFISPLPTTVVVLRFLLKAIQWTESDRPLDEVKTFVHNGVHRLKNALHFVHGKPSKFEQQIKKEARSWERFYLVLQAVEQAIQTNDPFAQSLQNKAQSIIEACRL